MPKSKTPADTTRAPDAGPGAIRPEHRTTTARGGGAPAQTGDGRPTGEDRAADPDAAFTDSAAGDQAVDTVATGLGSPDEDEPRSDRPR